MQVFADHREVMAVGPAAVTIGNFDGVHLGHRALLAAVDAAASARGLQRTVLTFEPHPTAVLAPHRAPPRICPPAEKLRRLEAAGVEVVVAQRFEPTFSALTPIAFIDEVLVQSLRAKHLVVGHDFGFGRRRAGTVEVLQAAAADRGFTVEVIAPLADVTGRIASSTAIRAAVQGGDPSTAAALLGSWFSLKGVVTQGEQRGRTLGFPTANVRTTWDLWPANGVYAGWLDHGVGPQAAVINVGETPTFGAGRAPTIEAHVLDQHGLALYDRPVRVLFADRLRGERRFPDAAHLVAQIHEDVEEARRRLAALTP